MAKRRRRLNTGRTAHRDFFGKKARPKKQKNEEEKLSFLIAAYLELQYPKVVFRFDVGADVRLTPNQASKIKNKLKHKRGYHDLTILEARGGYNGLLIELKKAVSEVYKLDGGLRKAWNKDTQSDHNLEQFIHLGNMRDKGYWADYGFGFEHTKDIIDNYMKMSYV